MCSITHFVISSVAGERGVVVEVSGARTESETLICVG